MLIPDQLAANCGKSPERAAWLARLPALVEECTARWSLQVGPPFCHDRVTCAWVAPATRAEGSAAILKLGMPHMEGEQEIAGLRYWDGDPTVALLASDDECGAMLLERCVPGSALNEIPEPEQDLVIGNLARRLRRRKQPDALAPFRLLSAMLDSWSAETLAQRRFWPDEGLVNEGLRLLQTLSAPAEGDSLLATDLHAGNVLSAEREPWLVIDPKPFLGDPAYDIVQHQINCEQRLHHDAIGLVHRMAELAEVDAERLRLWTFARAAAEPRDDWHNPLWFDVARSLAP
jgi:streptomycin 6-kinase